MKSAPQNRTLEYTLGLDIGASSLGWAIIETDGNKPVRLLDAGVSCFEAGVEGDIEKGKDASRSKVRRDHRLARRQHWRRAQRKRRVLKTLQQYGLLPETPPAEHQDECEEQRRHEMISQLDKSLLEKHGLLENHVDAQLLPYKLRALAANEPVTLHELGRVFYHLGQRRGYLSNRKTDTSLSGDDSGDTGDKNNDGVVKAGIKTLRQEMGDQTLGEYFATLSPIETRIRKRWTSRAMYIEEFNKIWEQQASHHDCLTPQAKREIYKAIFYQRPLKSQKGLIGKCELEPGKRRADLALPIVQEFRILQAINHLVLIEPDLNSRSLTISEKEILYDKLQDTEALSYAAVRKLLKCPKKSKFSIEEGGEKNIIGNRTRARLIPIFGDRWDSMSPEEQENIVYDLLHFEKEDSLVRHAKKIWGLSSEQARQVAGIALEQGYANHSKKALHKLADAMRSGMAYSTAKKEIYPESFETKEVFTKLPPVEKTFPELRNPAVSKALTQLRKVVNNIVRKYGIPNIVRIETARELKKSRTERKKITEKNRANEKARAAAKKRILEEMNIENPSRWDVEKVLLADECNWKCPYTGRGIDMQSLLGAEAQFDVEHIFPRRYLDNSYVNKTLCYSYENRHVKKDQLPYHAYHHDKEKWNEILNRVRTFKGQLARVKLDRFLTEEVPDGFVSKQLNDTRYNSVLAAEYLAMFYGGRYDEQGTLRVQSLAGGITAHLRREWQLESLLGGSKKNRDNHKHHAIDALVIALTDTGMVQRLSEAAQRASEQGSRKMFVSVQAPWNNFVPSVASVIDAINVYHQPKRKLAGPLEAGSNYSKAHIDANGKETYRIRKPIANLSKGEIERIIDPHIKKCIKDKLQELGTSDAKIFADPKNHPCLATKKGDEVPIHKVRIQISGNPRTIGKEPRKRNVLSGKGSNHHAVVVQTYDKKGNEKWEHHVVTRMEANRRLSKEARAAGEEVFQRDWGPNKNFLFSICANDYLELDGENGERILYRVAKLSAKQIQLWEHWQANTGNDDRTGGMFGNRIKSTDNLRKRHARKVRVTPLGEIIPAND